MKDLLTRRREHSRPTGTIFALIWLLVGVSLARGAARELPKLDSISPAQPFTFAVFGDNRGDNSGEQPEAFRQILRAINEASPAFAINTGDMIYGLTQDEALARDYWRRYQETLAVLRVPIFHVPGNHDIWSPASARLYREKCGPPYYTFDYGCARFIGLDCETEPGRLDAEQFAWLTRQLESAGPPVVFVILHRPLFPVDGAIGSSMDAHPADRDQLHQLFVQHRARIKAVFQGHEHIYHSEERHGVPYVITGGGGANLYLPPELGGFHHYLLVRVAQDKVAIEINKTGAQGRPLLQSTRVSPGTVLESWEQGLFWYVWDYTVTSEINPDRASEGKSGLQVNFDLAHCGWPVLGLPFQSPLDLRDIESFKIDVYLPENLKGDFSLTPSAEGTKGHEAPAVNLSPGWNSVRTALNAPWLPEGERNQVRSLGWSLSAAVREARGSVVFDNFALLGGPSTSNSSAQLSENWERALLWRVTDESSRARRTGEFFRHGKQGVQFHFDFAQCRQPRLLARPNPPWDLTAVRALLTDVYVPADSSGGLSVTLVARCNEIARSGPAVALTPGWNVVVTDLDNNWLPKSARAAVEHIELVLSSSNKTLKSWVVFDNLRAQGPG